MLKPVGLSLLMSACTKTSLLQLGHF
jgi:hypothetical protein